MSARSGALGRHRAAVIIGLVVVAIAVAITVTIRSGTSDHQAASPTSTTAAPGPGAELARLLARSRTLVFDARYTAVDQSSASSSAQVWRRPPLARLDTVSGSGDSARRNAQIITTSGAVNCSQVGTGPWSCAPKPGLRIGDVGVVPPVVVAALSSARVTARDDTVAGLSVRCFTVSGQDGSAELCVTPDGIPARMVAGAAHLDLVSLSRDRAADSVFVAPGPVTG